MRNTLKQAIVLWGMVLLLVLWSVFISPSGVLRWAGAAAIVLAVAAFVDLSAQAGVDGDDRRCRVVIAAAGNLPTAGSAGLWRSVGAPVH